MSSRPAVRPVAAVVFVVVLMSSLWAQEIADPAPSTEQASHMALRFGPGPVHKVLVGPHDGVDHAQLMATGAVRSRREYGVLTLYQIDEVAYGGREALAESGLPFRDDMNLVPVNGFVLDGTRPEVLAAAMEPALTIGRVVDAVLPVDAGLYLVQFDGPILDRWLDELRATGAQLVQYVDANAYVVRLDAAAVTLFEGLRLRHDGIQYAGAWQPAWRLSPVVRDAVRRQPGVPLPVTIQLIEGDGIRTLLEEIKALAANWVQSVQVGPYRNVQVDLDPVFYPGLAFHPRVFAIEERGELVRHDERQGQIVAGNVNTIGPTAPGYLSWLAGRGFNATQFGSFSVNVVDDATSLTGHPDLVNARVAFAQNPTSQSSTQGGHGFLNAHIVGGFNSQTGATYEDAAGYNYGLGIAPWALVGVTAIFGGGASSPTSWESSAYGLGARISSNSWGFSTPSGPVADYDSNSQEIDFIVRDAQGGTSGNQELSVIFAAGNDGSGANTVSTPGTAKNALTVGASENDRQTGTDGCGIGNSGANDVDDIISFSSRGPVNSSGGDGRWKPEIVAPGTHIQAGIPQSNYNGSSVCNAFWPAGSTLYGWSSGTSHSTPAVAGGAALARQWFLNQGAGTPTPAMIKAFLVNSATYMNGVGANDTLPSNSQGMGRMDLGRAFGPTPRLVVDQTQVLGTTGATYTLAGSVADSGQPLRITLVWTDAPGPTTGAPWVNNLDLTVVVGGNTYRGNVFSGANSITGGSADIRNNTESVFLPAGTTGAFTVTVTATGLGGDGVPGNADGTDQDFALVVYNGSAGGGPLPPVADFTANLTSGTAPLSVNFTDLSSGNVTTRSWTFGDGGTSTATNPSHSYATAGSYTVSLSVSGPDGSDVETKVGYISVSAPPTAGIADGSFELQTAGAAPSGAWSVDFGTGHVINPTTVSSDNGMPSAGTKWAEVGADSTNAATPPSNPGGVTNPSVGGAGISQTFSYPSGQTTLSFAAAFLRNEGANQTTYNDWMSIDVTDGATTRNLYYADTFSPTSGTSAKWGYAMTPVATTTVNLASLFPSSTTATAFTLTVRVGNASDNVQPSRGYVDDVRLTGSAPIPPTAEFSGTPLSGTAPLVVDFTDLSTGSVTSWSWTFGDGGTSIAQNPSHTYTSAGTYAVSLTATGPGGSDGETKSGYVTVSNPPAGGDLIYLSFTGTVTVPGVGSVADDDIVSYDPATGTWALYFDGSDVGLSGTDVNSFHVLSDGSIVFSIDSATFSIPGLIGGPSGTTVEDRDLVRFIPTSTGPTTAGSFVFYFDGSDVGLTTSSEDIDGLHIFADGSIAISTLGNPGVTGLTGLADEDVIVFTPTSLGSSTAGTWSFLFEGSDVDLSDSAEDLDAISFDGATMLFSTVGSYSGGGGAGDDEDVSTFTGTYGFTTSGTISLLLDLSALGIATGADVDGLSFSGN